MAYVNEEAIRDAIRNRIDGTITDTRAISTGTLDSDIAPGQTPATRVRKAVVVPRFTIVIECGIAEASPAEPCNLRIYEMRARIRSTYALPSDGLAADAYDAIKSTAGQNADAISQALGWPGSLTTTSGASGGTATGIASGCLRQEGSSQVITDDSQERLYEIEQVFRGFIQVAPATS